MANLNKEIWLAELKEDFLPNDSFLAEARDMSSLVEHDKINLAEAGATPEVYKGTITYPLGVDTRADTALEIALTNYATKQTRVGRLETIENVYDKLSSVIEGHKNKLRQEIAKDAIYSYAPATTSKKTPLINTTGAASDGFKSLTFEDVLKLRLAFNQDNVSQMGRVLVLTPEHEMHLLNEDRALYKAVMDTRSLYGFTIYTYDDMPMYDGATNTKLVLGGTPTSSHNKASVAFHKDEVMKAIGSYEMFALENDPAYQADVINFLVRAVAMPIRNRAISAVISTKI